MSEKKKIDFFHAAIIFGTATGYFFLLLFTLFPFTRSHFSLNPALYWFITGYFLFVPLFAYAVIMAKREGNRTLMDIEHALAVKRLSSKDWRYAIFGTAITFIFSGIIFGCSILLNKYFNVRLLNTTPWFMEEMRPFEGSEKLLLLVWLPMFFFNIVGEEILWRGYIQNRMEGKYAWLWCVLLWSVFHIPFGFDIMIMAAPAVLIIPYIFFKRKNTMIGVFIHGIYNGPIFICIGLGLLK